MVTDHFCCFASVLDIIIVYNINIMIMYCSTLQFNLTAFFFQTDCPKLRIKHLATLTCLVKLQSETLPDTGWHS